MLRESTPLFKVDCSCPNQSAQPTELRSRRTQVRQDGLVTGPEKDNTVGLDLVASANSSHGDNKANQTHIDNIPSWSQTRRRILRRKRARKQKSAKDADL